MDSKEFFGAKLKCPHCSKVSLVSELTEIDYNCPVLLFYDCECERHLASCTKSGKNHKFFVDPER
jgi:hypothetical protein